LPYLPWLIYLSTYIRRNIKGKDLKSKDFPARLNIAHRVLNKYYQITNMSPIYAAILILNPIFCMRYIELYWPWKWKIIALKAVKELWEQYREADILEPIIMFFLYKNQNPEEPEKLKKLDMYN